jgi:hypothetical protein
MHPRPRAPPTAHTCAARKKVFVCCDDHALCHAFQCFGHFYLVSLSLRLSLSISLSICLSVSVCTSDCLSVRSFPNSVSCLSICASNLSFVSPSVRFFHLFLFLSLSFIPLCLFLSSPSVCFFHLPPSVSFICLLRFDKLPLHSFSSVRRVID